MHWGGTSALRRCLSIKEAPQHWVGASVPYSSNHMAQNFKNNNITLTRNMYTLIWTLNSLNITKEEPNETYFIETISN